MTDRKRAMTMEIKNNRKISEGSMKDAVKKKLLKRGKKSKHPNVRDELSRTTTLDARYIGFGSSSRSSLASSLNWSVPSNLQGITSEMPPDSLDPTSLENIPFNLEMRSSLESMRYSSNPDFIAEPPSITRRPGSAGPDSFDVGVQVEARRPVFVYPTPPNSVSPTIPPDAIALSHTSQPHAHTTKHSSPSRHYRAITAHDMHDVASYHSSSSSSFDNRYSGASFPFVPEEESGNEKKLDESKDEPRSGVFGLGRMPITVSAPNVAQVRLHPLGIALPPEHSKE